MNVNETQYLDLAHEILVLGEDRDDRTGTGTLSLFGKQMRFDLTEGFPLLTTKFVPLRLIFEELRWFLNGETDVKQLIDRDVHIWDGDAYRDYCEEYGEDAVSEYAFLEMAGKYGYDLGPIYGHQWRSWRVADTVSPSEETVDQIANVIESIRTNPLSRRHIVSAWNPGDLEDMALPPCHVLFQFYVRDGRYLDCQLYQRSGDVFLGVPFNIASYALLTHMIARIVGLTPGYFIHTLGDSHIYKNHVKQVEQQLSRTPRELPTLKLHGNYEDPADFTWEDVELIGYDPYPAIKGKVSVG